MTYFRQILKFALPYQGYAYLNMLFNVLYAFFSTLSFIALIPMLNVLFRETEPVREAPILKNMSFKAYLEKMLNYFVTQKVEADGQLSVLFYLILIIIVVFLLKNICNYFALFFITFLKNGVLKDIRISLYQKILDLPISFFSEKRKGDVMARISSDVGELQNSFLAVLELIIRDPLTIIITISAMTYMSPKLTLFVFIFIPVSGYIISIIGKALKKSSSNVQREQGVFLSIMEETLGGFKIIKTFNAEKYFGDKFRTSALKSFQYLNILTNRYNLSSPMSEFLGIVVISVILWQGGSLVLIDKTMNASSFIVYIGLAYNILTPAKAISQAMFNIKKGDAAAQRVLEIINAEVTIKDKDVPVEKEHFEEKIELKNITFKYQDDYILKNFSLTIPKGKMVALVGQSGSGKTTVANLVTRLYDVDEGSIEIDGVDIRDMSQNSLRKLIGFVGQDNVLFNDTIRNNVALGSPMAEEDKIYKALEASHSYEFVAKLPNGIDQNIGDSGNKLSGGQKQRIAIARAIFKDAPIMVLDEATSALDSESEKLVQNALENIMEGRTSIVIAHRLSTIQKADIIVVMQQGKIIEMGSHKDLMDRGEVYSTLVKIQSL